MALKYDTRQYPPTLTPDEAAELMRIKPTQVRQLLRTGKLKGKKPGGIWYIPKTEVLAYIGLSEPA
ncbi:helix-turn-helix domain-containing protein [Ruminococcaceae bacterium OttesenSCG-928-A16]|nr:helix-turn-helix domain-containing protein [Ruminococcaceae bacterium OttesenSCG-928-A16]